MRETSGKKQHRERKLLKSKRKKNKKRNNIDSQHMIALEPVLNACIYLFFLPFFVCISPHLAVHYSRSFVSSAYNARSHGFSQHLHSVFILTEFVFCPPYQRRCFTITNNNRQSKWQQQRNKKKSCTTKLKSRA